MQQKEREEHKETTHSDFNSRGFLFTVSSKIFINIFCLRTSIKRK